MSLNINVEDFTVVWTENQTNGRGQMGSVWSSEKNKNLTFSVFLDTSWLPLEKQFYLNCAVAFSVLRALKRLSVPKLNIKWPNDILSDNKKVSGVLIENLVKNATRSHSVIGIGLNVNQIEFEYKNASSLKCITGIHYSLEELLNLIVELLKEEVERLRKGLFKEVYKEYEAYLFRLNKPSTFELSTGERFVGIIIKVTKDGKLQLLLEDEIVSEYGLKEIKLLY